jgi:PilZ domain
MNLDSRLTGREEKRLPIMMEVKLAPVAGATSGPPERTITDNMSPHGIRVRSTCEWRLGEQAEIVPTKGGTPMRGEVVYCQKVAGGRFFVGLRFASSRVPWSILQRFNGLLLGDIFCAMRWKA